MLARRLGRHGEPVLAGLLAHDAAPAALASSTLQAASLGAAGKSLAAGLVSANVAALTRGVLTTMLLSKLRAVMVVVFILGLAGGATLYRSRAAAPPAKAPKGTDERAIQGTW